jgi:hypothetical protein
MPHKWVDSGNRINQSLNLLGVPEFILPVDVDLRSESRGRLRPDRDN